MAAATAEAIMHVRGSLLAVMPTAEAAAAAAAEAAAAEFTDATADEGPGRPLPFSDAKG